MILLALLIGLQIMFSYYIEIMDALNTASSFAILV